MDKKTFHNMVRITSVICAILLFMAILKAPREYYWLLRPLVFIGAILVIIKNIAHSYWVLLFVVVVVLFNPIFPIYLYKKTLWMPLDIITGVLFLIEVISSSKVKKGQEITKNKEAKKFKRDKVY